MSKKLDFQDLTDALNNKPVNEKTIKPQSVEEFAKQVQSWLDEEGSTITSAYVYKGEEATPAVWIHAIRVEKFKVGGVYEKIIEVSESGIKSDLYSIHLMDVNPLHQLDQRVNKSLTK